MFWTETTHDFFFPKWPTRKLLLWCKRTVYWQQIMNLATFLLIASSPHSPSDSSSFLSCIFSSLFLGPLPKGLLFTSFPLFLVGQTFLAITFSATSLVRDRYVKDLEEWIAKEIVFQVQWKERLWVREFCLAFFTDIDYPGFHTFLQLALTNNHRYHL